MSHELPSVRKHMCWHLALAAAAALVGLASSPLHADDRFWVAYGDSGSFSSPTNWSMTNGGAIGGGPPGVNDIANFTLNDTYSVTFGFGVTNERLHVSNGNVEFILFNGLTYTLTDGSASVDIGFEAGQAARLTVRDGVVGIDAIGGEVILGRNEGSGFLIVTTNGAVGTAALRPTFFLGAFGGSGTLTVNDNGRVEAENIFVAHGPDTTGTVTVAGPNALMNNVTTTVGDYGDGTVTVSNGGTLSSSASARLGQNLGADGAVTVSGAGSSWAISGTTTLGNNGDGALAISAGGFVSSVGAVTFGTTATGIGTATVSGANSRWELSAAQTIGASGLGVVSVSSGGQVVSSANAVLGLNAAGEGRVTVTGAGSLWTLGGVLNVGFNGTGNLLVSAGGEVSAPTLTIGYLGDGNGAATITGTGSKLTTGGEVTVVNAGSGTLHVVNGAVVDVGTDLSVGNPAGSAVGTLNLDSGSIYVAGAFANNGVFNFTDGLLRVAGNFQPNAAGNPLAINGADHGDVPTVDLIGVGTTTNVTALTVGGNHRGQLLLRQGRVLDVGANSVSIGAAVGGEGTISVQSGARLVTTQNLSVGGTGTTVGGAGTLEISGGTVDADALRVFRDGTIRLNSGTLALNTLPVLDGEFNWTGGTLRFDAATSLNSGNLPKLLDLDGTIRAGQTLASSNGVAVTLQTPLVVDGGTLNVSLLVNQSTLEVRSGSTNLARAATNSAGAHLIIERELSIGDTLTNASGARIELVGGTGRLVGSTFTSVPNNGLILGDGTISAPATNNATGKIRVDTGQTLFFTRTFAPNAGELNLQGGTLDFSGPVTNNAGAFIAGRGALYTGGLTNHGQMAFSGGIADIHGDVTLSAGSRVVTGGAGSTTTFFDDVVHNGLEIFTGASASTVFFGNQSGSGSFTGTGTVYYVGDLRPGNSPALVSHGGSVVLGSATVLTMELAGGTPGSQYDQLNISGSAALAGTLDIDLIDGFAVAANDSFTLMNFGTRSGTFAAVDYPPLPAGLTWELDYGETVLVLSVSSTLLPGDIDLDGDVDRVDAALFASHFGMPSGAVWTTGDFNGDGKATLGDLALLQAHFGATAAVFSPSATSTAVPEPTPTILLMLGITAMAICYRVKTRSLVQTGEWFDHSR